MADLPKVSSPTISSVERDQPDQVLASMGPVLALLDGLPAMLGCWDRELRNVLANRPYRDYFGFEPEQMRGRHIREVLGEQVYALNLPYMQAALAGREQLFDRTLVDTSGRLRHVQASYVPWRVDGAVQGFFVLVTDVTERVVAEQAQQASLNQYRALAANIPGGFVLLFDETLTFLVAEGPALAQFGFSAADLEGHTLFDAFPPELADELEPRYRGALGGRTIEWERRIGDSVFALSAAPVRSAPDQTPFAGMVIARDVTTERRTGTSLQALHQVARAVARNARPEEVAGMVASNLEAIFHVDAAAVVHFVAGSGGVLVAQTPRQPETLPSEVRFADVPDSAVAVVARTGQPARVEYPTGTGSALRSPRSERLRVGAAAPIHHRGQLWGAIAVAADERDRLGDDVLAQLAEFAELVEIALGNLDAWRTLTEQATLDALTGLPNRRVLEEHLSREIDRAARTGEPLSLVLIDVDDFKHVNDRYGHPTGDRVLAELASCLTDVIRDSEVVARLGGEEFAWVLPKTDTARARAAAERARVAVAALPFHDVGPLTISLGVCTTTHSVDPLDVIKAADGALYEAKRLGRNRVAVSRGPVTPAGGPGG